MNPPPTTAEPAVNVTVDLAAKSLVFEISSAGVVSAVKIVALAAGRANTVFCVNTAGGPNGIDWMGMFYSS